MAPACGASAVKAGPERFPTHDSPMLWQRWVGRFLQVGAIIGAMLTLVEWATIGAAHVRPGRIVLGSAIAGAIGATIATGGLRRH